MKKNNLTTTNIKYYFNLKGLKKGVYSSRYFLKTQQILKSYPQQISVLQFAILNEGEFVVAGISEVVSLLKQVLPRKIFKRLKIYGQVDGAIIKGKTGVLYIEGYYGDICMYENIIDGILNERIGVATKAKVLVDQLAPHQEIIYMADRNNDYCSQAGNGLAAYLGGIRKFSTKQNLAYVSQIDHQAWDVGTMPHALIQQFGGDLNAAVKAYLKTFKHQKAIALLDYHNDVIQALNDIQPLLGQLYGVRLDTSKLLVDKSLVAQNLAGVNNQMVTLVRHWLDSHQAQHVKIIVSSGIDDHKIQLFNQATIKPDVFGVGGFFLSSILNITADLVKRNHQNEAKQGRFCFVDYEKELKLYK